MLWCETLVQQVEGPQVINDSKTPSGPVHVGSLRGVLIHDAVYRVLLDRGVPARYLYGVDDYDPLDELPATEPEYFRRYLGVPLCNVPAPPGSTATDMAEHYISEFFKVFDELGVRAETYRMRDIYRTGTFDGAIDTILSKADVVRRIDRVVANARRDDDWFPFQVVCERCGRLGTTKVFAYDGERVSYHCLPDLVKWAQGCGHSGKVSPFSGNGKLSWKLEWVAKWHHFPVTIEGAGKDHNTRGGSRDVAVRCLTELFGDQPPLNIPYEFFLVGGAKMSSSRGVGVTAREMADLLPPELLRFLMIRTQPRRPVDFSPDQDKIVRLYADFDRVRGKAAQIGPSNEATMYALSEVNPEPGYFAPSFDLVLSLVQMPHLDIAEQVRKLKGDELTALDLRHLRGRADSARNWLDRYATDEDRFELKPELPEEAASLTAAQAVFLHQLADRLEQVSWEPADLQVCIFNTARLTPIGQPDAFRAIYTVLAAKASGPKAGNLLAFLERALVVGRFRAVPAPAIAEFWSQSSIPTDQLEAWLTGIRDSAVEVHAVATQAPDDQTGVLEVTASLTDGKTYLRRCTLPSQNGAGRAFRNTVAEHMGVLDQALGKPIPFSVSSIVP